MTTIKNCTDIGQSKRLVEILGFESVDMYYHYTTGVKSYYEDVPKYVQVFNHFVFFHNDIPCWSFSALFDVLPDGTDVTKDKSDIENEKYMCTVGVENDIISTFADNPVDACYEMVLKLHERKML